MENKEITPFLIQIRSLLCLTLSHLKSYAGKGDKALQKDFDALIEKVRNVGTEKDIASVKNDYRSLVMKMDEDEAEEEAIEKKSKESIFTRFFHKDEKEEVKEEGKDDSLQDLLRITEELLEAFAKGSLLIVNEKSPLYQTILRIKAGGYQDFTYEQLSEYGQQIISFFMDQSWEKEVVTKERNELKNIIALLASNIEEFGTETTSFDAGLGKYVTKIEEASSVADIVAAKKAILFETEKIHQANQRVNEKLKKAREKINESTMRISELEEELKKANLEKVTDPLTMVFNRSALDRRVETAIKQVRGGEKLVSIIMFDLDDFKKFNDTYGNHAGDQVLKTIAMLAKEVFVEKGYVYRHGGEEFAIILFEKPFSFCMKKARELLKIISSHQFTYRKKIIQITISIGVTMVQEKDTLKLVYARADHYLCQAKSEGKNRIAGK